MPLSKQHALITGGGTGIGAAIARRLALSNAAISIVGRREPPLQEVAGEIDGAHVATADVTDESSLRAAIASAEAVHGPISVLVNNAGAASSAPFLKTDADMVRRMLTVNVEGVFLVTRAVLPNMLEANFGRIVTVASTAGLKGYPYISAYATAKHAVIGMTRVLALEMAKTGITVNAVCPGYTDTELVRSSVRDIKKKTGRDEDEIIDGMVAGNPQGRLITPEEVADSVHWLCGPNASAINGQSIIVAGGEIM